MDIAMPCEQEQLTEEQQQELLTRVIREYNRDEHNLIQILHYAQAIYGFLPLDVQRQVARDMDVPLSRISGVVSFYSYFSTEPRGEHTISVCLGTACYVRGGKKIVDRLKEVLDVEVGETTPDRLFSLEIKRCFGSCGLAPAVSIDDTVHKRVNPNKIQQILRMYGWEGD